MGRDAEPAKGLASLPSSIWFQLALAVGGGVWWAFCFDERPGLVVPIAATVPLFLITAMAPEPGRRLWLGWLHGTVAWLVAVPWIASTLTLYGGLPSVASAFLLTLLALYLGLYHGVFCWLAGSALARRDVFSLVLAPAIWVSLEWLRGLGPSGFPWNLLGYAWVDVPGALDVTRWVGSHGLSALVAAFGLALLGLADRETRRQAAVGIAAVAVLLAVARWTNLDRPPAAASPVELRLEQPNIHMETVEMQEESAGVRLTRIQTNYQSLFAYSRLSCDPGTLVVWPESAGWPYELERDAQFAQDVEDLVAGGCSLLFNSTRRFQSGDVEGAYNSAYLLTPSEGAADRQIYDKMHLVPFGEYVPLGRFLPRLRQLARNTGSYSPGDEVRLLDHGDARLGVSICFEIVFPAQVAARVRRGASVLVTMTNDSWYGRTWAPYQHLRPARFRAAENSRPLIRAAITGISAVIDYRGETEMTTPIDEVYGLETPVFPLDRMTLFSRAPLLVPLLCLLLAAFAILRRR